MAKEFDIDRLIAEQSRNLGTSGNRNPADVADTTRILTQTRNGESDLVVTPTGALASTEEEGIKKYLKENPEAILPLLKDLKTSF